MSVGWLKRSPRNIDGLGLCFVFIFLAIIMFHPDSYLSSFLLPLFRVTTPISSCCCSIILLFLSSPWPSGVGFNSPTSLRHVLSLSSASYHIICGNSWCVLCCTEKQHLHYRLDRTVVQRGWQDGSFLRTGCRACGWTSSRSVLIFVSYHIILELVIAILDITTRKWIK